jgi:hypothetical protein
MQPRILYSAPTNSVAVDKCSKESRISRTMLPLYMHSSCDKKDENWVPVTGDIDFFFHHSVLLVGSFALFLSIPDNLDAAD